MKSIGSLSLFFLTTSTAIAQYGWFWQNPVPQGNCLLAVCFTDANTGTAVGAAGTIFRTTNGGAKWTSQTTGTANYLWGVSFTDSSTGTVVGQNGTILRTTDGGTTWGYQSSLTTDDLTSVSFTDATTGTATGQWGTVLRTITGGSTSVKGDKNPDLAWQFTLNQNYPNPFNPTTMIRYELSTGVYVSLNVYDILGRAVKTLVNEAKQAGTYTVQFDGSRLASGVYFYRLKAGSYVETKRLLLLK